ncbi:MAG TPA: ArsI/CadI family heavy metal resistance metalloenzyme [Amycolatopsis sp.]|nr:ArsI/CadI family heavy metal resistance metalloenzyme [Amycolatopsis sp.]
MSRMQLALRVGDLAGSIEFYSKLFNTEPAKRREGYANFAVSEPPLKLVLLEGEPGQDTVMDHLGVEVDSADEVDAAGRRLAGEGLDTVAEGNTTCCYALQDKVWVHGPGQEPWEVYTVKADSASFGTDSLALVGPATCCTPEAESGQADTAGRPEGCCA